MWSWKRKPQTVAERVANGVKLLDAKIGCWVDLVDLDELSLASSYSCVIGQLYGDFGEGVQQLGITRKAQRLGFEVDLDGWNEPFGVAYRELDTEWRRVILERRAVAS